MDEEEIDQFDENDEMFSDLSTLDQELNDDLITDSVCDTEPRINPCSQRWQHHFNEENTIPPSKALSPSVFWNLLLNQHLNNLFN